MVQRRLSMRLSMRKTKENAHPAPHMYATIDLDHADGIENRGFSILGYAILTPAAIRKQGTILIELWRVAFRRTYYTSVALLERDLQAYLRFYDRERPHQGYRMQECTPAAVFPRPESELNDDHALGW